MSPFLAKYPEFPDTWMLINFAIRNSIYEMLIDGSNTAMGLRLSLHVVSPSTSSNTHGWLYARNSR